MKKGQRTVRLLKTEHRYTNIKLHPGYTKLDSGHVSFWKGDNGFPNSRPVLLVMSCYGQGIIHEIQCPASLGSRRLDCFLAGRGKHILCPWIWISDLSRRAERSSDPCGYWDSRFPGAGFSLHAETDISRIPWSGWWDFLDHTTPQIKQREE